MLPFIVSLCLLFFLSLLLQTSSYSLLIGSTLPAHRHHSVRPNRHVPSVTSTLSGHFVSSAPSAARIATTSSERQLSLVALCSTSPSIGESSSSTPSGPRTDYRALAKYAISLHVQLSLLSLLFRSLDFLGSAIRPVPTPLAGLIFAALSLKSRVFNILDNERPDRRKAVSGGETTKGFGDRVMPRWTPPGVFFPIMWVLIITPLRAVSSAIIYHQCGQTFFNEATMGLMLHLGIGDVWNCINNTEKRYGTSALAVLVVLWSVLNACRLYSQISALAGLLLGLTSLWIATASALTIDTWRLNGREPFLPETDENGETRTEFIV